MCVLHMLHKNCEIDLGWVFPCTPAPALPPSLLFIGVFIRAKAVWPNSDRARVHAEPTFVNYPHIKAKVIFKTNKLLHYTCKLDLRQMYSKSSMKLCIYLSTLITLNKDKEVYVK